MTWSLRMGSAWKALWLLPAPHILPPPLPSPVLPSRVWPRAPQLRHQSRRVGRGSAGAAPSQAPFPAGSTPSSSSASRLTSPSGSHPASSPVTSFSPKMPLTSETSGSSCPTTGGSLGPDPALHLTVVGPTLPASQLQELRCRGPEAPSVSAPPLLPRGTSLGRGLEATQELAS